MMLIDTHLHLADESNVGEIVKRASLDDVKYMILGGTNEKDNEENISLTKKYENVFTTIGYHPSEVFNITDDSFEKLNRQIKEEKVVAIGEIGLDYYYGKDDQKEQQALFERQLMIAESNKLPVVIHSRDATKETMEILKRYNVKGVVHCFSGSLETALEYIKMGYYLGIGGVLTFKNSNLKEIIKNVSLDHIILETDSPFLSPYRGQKNEPKNIKLTASFLADIKNVSLDYVAMITTKNACSIFDLNIRL